MYSPKLGCESGRYYTIGQCDLCPSNSYCIGGYTGSATAVTCSHHGTTTGTGANSESDCQCPIGWSATNGDCSTGCAIGWVYDGGNDQCDICPSDYWCAGGFDSAQACANGNTNFETGKSLQSECLCKQDRDQ
jgi:hypothetical protein